MIHRRYTDRNSVRDPWVFTSASRIKVQRVLEPPLLPSPSVHLHLSINVLVHQSDSCLSSVSCTFPYCVTSELPVHSESVRPRPSSSSSRETRHPCRTRFRTFPVFLIEGSEVLVGHRPFWSCLAHTPSDTLVPSLRLPIGPSHDT